MKRIFVVGLFAFFGTTAFANDPDAVSEKVLKSFKETFTHAQNVKWHENDDNYSVRFYQGDTKYIVYYNKKGRITGSMKFYEPALLPTRILANISREYPDNTSLYVTEISVGNDVAYFVKMQDENYWYTIRYDNNGESSEHEKIRKQK